MHKEYVYKCTFVLITEGPALCFFFKTATHLQKT